MNNQEPYSFRTPKKERRRDLEDSTTVNNGLPPTSHAFILRSEVTLMKKTKQQVFFIDDNKTKENIVVGAFT